MIAREDAPQPMYHNGSMRVLDLGCGRGRNIVITKVASGDEMIGLDIAFDRLQAAATRHAYRRFIQADALKLPFGDEVFRCVVCQVGMPYMNIPVALAEISRVLETGGTVHFRLHAFRFTMHELKNAFPRPKAMAFRLWVLTNGLILHFTGKPVAIGGRYESFQTRRGMSMALRQAGFEEIEFSWLPDNFTNQLIVSARKPVHMGEGIPISAQVKPALI
jgi:ubiquinone/menaquinone biosynthesis C-methylase UbiE